MKMNGKENVSVLVASEWCYCCCCCWCWCIVVLRYVTRKRIILPHALRKSLFSLFQTCWSPAKIADCSFYFSLLFHNSHKFGLSKWNFSNKKTRTNECPSFLLCVYIIMFSLIDNFLLSTYKMFFHTTTFIAIRKYTTEFACTAQTSIVSFVRSVFFPSFSSSLVLCNWFCLACVHTFCGVAFSIGLFLFLCLCCRLVLHYGVAIHIFMRSCMYRFITHRIIHTVTNVRGALLMALSH